VLNNYAYYLTLRNEKLDKAAEMSKKSNELRPDDATFEDTYAWVFYKQGKYEDAKIWLEKAFAHGGDKSGAILEHYGDLLFKMGKVEDALTYWNKAKVTGEFSELLEKKIVDKKLYE
jgi:tetratricopeptide (TPR) repeat protein